MANKKITKKNKKTKSSPKVQSTHIPTKRPPSKSEKSDIPNIIRISLSVLVILLSLHLALSVVSLKESIVDGKDTFISSGGAIGTVEAIFVKGLFGYFSFLLIGLLLFWSISVLLKFNAKGVLKISGKILLFWFLLSLMFGLSGDLSGAVGQLFAGYAQKFLGFVGAWIFATGFLLLFIWFMIGVYYLRPLFSKIKEKISDGNIRRMEEKAKKRKEIMDEYQAKTKQRYDRLSELTKTGSKTPAEYELDIPESKPQKQSPVTQSKADYGTFSIDVSKFLEKQEKQRQEQQEKQNTQNIDLTGDVIEEPIEPSRSSDLLPTLNKKEDFTETSSDTEDVNTLDLSPDFEKTETPEYSATPAQEKHFAEETPKQSHHDENISPNTDAAISEGLEKAREIAIKSNQPKKQEIPLTRGDANEQLKGRGVYYYQQPSLDNLVEPQTWGFSIDEQRVHEQSLLLEETLAHFKINGEITRVTPGPVITRFEYRPQKGIKISKISSLSDDLAMALKAVSIRIIAPIPGKDVVGIEIPNPKRKTVFIKEIFLTDEFRDNSGSLPLALGTAVDGKPVVIDLAKAPHLLVAGATGSGKSVCVNTIITSLLYSQTPSDLRIIMIDPKRLELSVYKDIPFMVSEPVVEPKEAINAFNWAVEEMTTRYRMLADVGVRDLKDFNKRVSSSSDLEFEPLPRIVIIVDELADLMITSASQIEEPIARIAQMARAVGIHLILATQRPSVDVLTGLIKANFPSRIAFTVRSQIDSRTIIDMAGAEKLLGYGDMLFLNSSLGEPQRIHGSLVTTEETEKIVKELSQYKSPFGLEDFSPQDADGGPGIDGKYDEYLIDAAKLVVINQKGSASMLQRKMRIGYNRAGSIIDQLEFLGIVGPSQGSKPRDVRVRELDELNQVLQMRGLHDGY